ncbi:PREDICTED: uncharacterized protein LOC104813576 [Tarenaya hassleriana]|uniref:uncharacterized protein LOC104813576 n=1 Tax=Tarenaya hassleriana TaxID=28532 RepID=UPI00053C4624|nr:PREDICTED: uncharacterized protein LOC104813576 [Tarenaya hassleriana]
MATIRVSSIRNPFSSTICRNIYRYKSFRGSTKSFCSLPYLGNGSIRQSFRVGRQLSCCKTFKRRLNAKKTDSEDDEEEDEDESKAVETVLQLYTDIKNKNMKGVAEVIGDECNCFCNFLSTFRSLHGKKQVLAFFYWLMKILGENTKLVVKPSSKNGLTVGVHWRLEWEKPNIPLGKGFSFHICHVYQGKLLIKNLEMFMEPIFHMEPIRLKAIAFAVSMAEKMSTYMRPGENTRKQAMTLLLLSLVLLTVAIVYFTRPRFC